MAGQLCFIAHRVFFIKNFGVKHQGENGSTFAIQNSLCDLSTICATTALCMGRRNTHTFKIETRTRMTKWRSSTPEPEEIALQRFSDVRRSDHYLFDCLKATW